MERHDNYYETAVQNFTDALNALGPVPAQPMAHLIEGLQHLALGLSQERQLMEASLLGTCSFSTPK
jgi:hypothetical protein